MNRHLHNTLSALSVSGALLVLGLIAAAPLMPPDARQTLSERAAAAPALHASRAQASDPATAAMAMLSGAIGQATMHNSDAASSNVTRDKQDQRRQTLVMPYLSFLPRG